MCRAAAFNEAVLFIAQAKKQPWSTSLCHSLIPHTNVDLSLRFANLIQQIAHSKFGSFTCSIKKATKILRLFFIFSLPNMYPFVWRQVHLITFFYVEGFVKCIHVNYRTIGPVLTWRMRVGQYHLRSSFR